MEEQQPSSAAKAVVFAWGKNDCGQLGTGRPTSERLPTVVAALKDYKVTSVACGPEFSAVLTEDGRVFMFGKCARQVSGQFGNEILNPVPLTSMRDEVVISAACGGTFTFFITEQHHAYGVGFGKEGQLGVVKPPDYSETPLTPQDLPKAKQIACGFMHSVALTVKGEVWAWGSGGARLGLGEMVQALPKRVPTLNNVVKVACGKVFSAAITAEGELYTWGDFGEFGQLGLGQPSKGTKSTEGPTKVALPHKVVDIACGDNHCLCVVAAENEQKSLYAWGRNAEGQLGLGDISHRWSPEVVPFFKDKAVSRIACGAKFSLVATDDHHLYAFGQGEYEQLGQKKLTNEWTPKRIPVFGPERKILDISAGMYHVLAVVAETDAASPAEAENSDSEDNEWEVEEVIGQRRNEFGTIEYLIKWKGYGPERDSWEAASNVHCPELIAEYQKKRREEKEAEEGDGKEKDETAKEEHGIVEKIIKKRVHEGEKQYFVKWQGQREKTWVSASSLESNKAAINEYEASQTKQRKELEKDLEEHHANGDNLEQKKKRLKLLKHSKGKTAPRWVGDPIIKKRGRTYYKCVQIGERQFAIGETVAVSNGDRPDMYAEVESLYEDRKGKAHVNLKWMYKPEDVLGGRKPHHGEFELFKSNHVDPNPVEMMLGHANVMNPKEFEKYLNEKKKNQEEGGDSSKKEKEKETNEKSKREPPVYFVKQFYDHLEDEYTDCDYEGVTADNIIDDLDEDDNNDEEESSAVEEDDRVVVIPDEQENRTGRGKRKRETKPKETKKKEPEKKKPRVVKQKEAPKTKASPGRKKKRADDEEKEEKKNEPKNKKAKVAPKKETGSKGKDTQVPAPVAANINDRLQKLAGEENKGEEVKKLLAEGANPRYNATSLLQCSIHFAAAFGRTDTIRVLLDHDKGMVDLATKKNWTPLHYATHNKHLEAVQVLLEYGANPLVQTSEGKTPLEIAKAKNTPAIIEALQQAIEQDESVGHLAEAI